MILILFVWDTKSLFFFTMLFGDISVANSEIVGGCLGYSILFYGKRFIIVTIFSLK